MSSFVKNTNIGRYKIIEITKQAKAAHIASALSCYDLIYFLYNHYLQINSFDDIERDRFILSKGHAAAALYVAMNQAGLITNEQLKTFGEIGSFLEEHPSPKLEGIETASGSLGHGLAVGAGIALGSKIRNLKNKNIVLMGDGEQNEGTVWEAALFASAQKLDNLIGIIDYNKWQATGRSNQILDVSPLAKKWESFGWTTLEIDGHNLAEFEEALSSDPVGKPKMIIANTIKGKGVSFMEDDNNWHYRLPTDAEMQDISMELNQ
jgi:transketolase